MEQSMYGEQNSSKYGAISKVHFASRLFSYNCYIVSTCARTNKNFTQLFNKLA